MFDKEKKGIIIQEEVSTVMMAKPQRGDMDAKLAEFFLAAQEEIKTEVA